MSFSLLRLADDEEKERPYLRYGLPIHIATRIGAHVALQHGPFLQASMSIIDFVTKPIRPTVSIQA